MDGHCEQAPVQRGVRMRRLAAGFLGDLRGPVITLPVDQVRGRLFGRAFHQTSPSSVSATLVKMQLARRVAMALGLVFSPVPSATPR